MADFCRECHNETFGEDCPFDLEGLCKEGQMIQLLCEGCGKIIWIDHKGYRIR